MNSSLAVVLGLLPAVLMAGGALTCAVVAFLRPRTRTSLYRWITVLVAGAAFAASMLELASLTHRPSGLGTSINGGALVVDRFHVFGSVMAEAVVVLAVLGAEAYTRRVPARAGAFCSLLLLSGAATAMLVGQDEMAAFTASLALLAVCLVVLTAMTKTSSLTAEAALRQLLAGGIALATAIYGLVLLYVATGTSSLAQLATGSRAGGGPLDGVLVTVGITMTVLGVLAVAGVPPLHAWIREVQGSTPGPIAGFTSAIGVVAATSVLGRFSIEAFGAGSPYWTTLVEVLAAAAMVAGALLALRATTIRGLIADLTITQSGFLLLAAAASGHGVTGNVLAGTTVLAFALMAAAASLVATLLLAGIFDAAGLGTALESYRGVGRRAPATAAFLALALLGLAGVPPLAGFVSRLLITESAVDGGATWAAAIALIAFVVAAAGVARWLAAMYADDSDEPAFEVTTTPLLSRMTAWTAALLGLLLAAFAGPLISLAGGAATSLH